MNDAHILTGISHVGDLALLDGPLLALFCSRRCPGNVILRAYDLAVALRDSVVPVIGGFHTPVEKELLRVLLRGSAPVVIVEARGRRTRRTKEVKERESHIAAGRLLVLWPFPDDQTRVTQPLAAERNRIVAGLASRTLFLHAAPGGATERLARELAATGAPLLTLALEDGANDNLLEIGAVAVAVAGVSTMLHGQSSPAMLREEESSCTPDPAGTLSHQISN